MLVYIWGCGEELERKGHDSQWEVILYLRGFLEVSEDIFGYYKGRWRGAGLLLKSSE